MQTSPRKPNLPGRDNPVEPDFDPVDPEATPDDLPMPDQPPANPDIPPVISPGWMKGIRVAISRDTLLYAAVAVGLASTPSFADTNAGPSTPQAPGTSSGPGTEPTTPVPSTAGKPSDGFKDAPPELQKGVAGTGASTGASGTAGPYNPNPPAATPGVQ
jgi:hypothetical protein